MHTFVTRFRKSTRSSLRGAPPAFAFFTVLHIPAQVGAFSGCYLTKLFLVLALGGALAILPISLTTTKLKKEVCAPEGECNALRN